MKTKVDKPFEKTNINESKVRWREHEMILVTILAATSLAGYLWRVQNLTDQEIKTIYAAPFINHQIPFNYYRNILLPQIGSVVLIYLCYLWINLFIVPYLLFPKKRVIGTFQIELSWKKISLKGMAIVFLKKYLWIALQVVLISYFIALGANIASYYSHPYYFNYGGFQFLALFGYNDQPLKNLFAGFDRAIGIIAAFALLACVREVIIYYIEISGSRRSYWFLITNQVTAILVVYFSIFFFLSIFNLVHENSFFVTYFSFISPVLLVFMSNTYWLFPLKEGNSFFNSRIIARLLLSTFICTLPFSFFLVNKEHPFIFLIYWAVQLFIVTPITWIFYQQRRDKILQLRGVEKALVKSNADLQFLRSQINPHFLFNTLNTLYGTALQEGSQNTAEGIQKLGDMMRFMLHENNQDFISMDREIEYLENYISLQKLRTQSSPGIVIEDNINKNHCYHKIAPMLLIPFVENAFKHGISQRKNHG